MASITFGKYVVTAVLGSGGMAEVYAGIHPDLGRKVAIKVILPQFATESNFEERFRREARVVASLRHAHIVQLYDFDVVEGRHFMVMEYLDGGTLKEHLRALQQQKLRMSLPEIANLIDAIAGALDYAHSRGTVHRDIKPANILFTAAREAVLTDFGIAKLLEDAARLTATGGVVGSPFYMPPEQATGGVVDARSDQYSLGVVLYEMATGRVPFQGSSAVAVMTQHLNSAPPAPRTVNAALPVAVEAVLLKALAKQPGDRFGSAGELAQAFRQAVAGQSSMAFSAPSLDENARTVLSRAGAPPDNPVNPTLDPAVYPTEADAATVVSAGSPTSLPAEDPASVMTKRTEAAAPPPVSTPTPRVESPQAGPPPAGPGGIPVDQPPVPLDQASLPAVDESRPRAPKGLARELPMTTGDCLLCRRPPRPKPPHKTSMWAASRQESSTKVGSRPLAVTLPLILTLAKSKPPRPNRRPPVRPLSRGAATHRNSPPCSRRCAALLPGTP